MDDETQCIQLLVSSDRMKVELACHLSHESLDSLRTAIREQIDGLGLAAAACRLQFEEWLEAEAATEPKAVQAILYEGQEPGASQDGSIDWQGDFFNREFHVDQQTGAVDYRRREAKDTVESGQLLARLVPPVQGADGVDVFGEVVPARTAAATEIEVGKNVEGRGDGFYATKQGKVRWASSCLAVDDILHVEGDVGLESGDIRHNGAVIVGGDIQEGATIEAEGAIEVRGIVAPSSIETGGDLLVQGGIKGAENRNIHVAGEVRAKFVLDANIEAHGDVVIKREITNSVIKTRGSIQIPKGRIVGGKVTALRGITAGTTGSPLDVKTTLVSGVDFTLPPEQRESISKLAVLEEQRKATLHTVDALRESAPPGSLGDLPRAEELQTILADIETEIAHIRDDLDENALEAAGVTEFPTVILSKLCANTHFIMCARTLRVVEDQRGPVQVAFTDGKLEIIRAKQTGA